MNDYLSKLPSLHRKHLLNTCKKNKTFDKFLNLAKKNNIDLFNYDKINSTKKNAKNQVKTKDEIEEVINKIKIKCIKAYGVDIVKNIKYDDNIISLLKNKLERVENRIADLDQLLFLVNFFYDNNLLYKYLSFDKKQTIVTKIKYTENEPSSNTKRIKLDKSSELSKVVIEDDSSKSSDKNNNLQEVENLDRSIMELFVSSDNSESIYESDNDVNIQIDSDSPYIAEYSNLKKDKE